MGYRVFSFHASLGECTLDALGACSQVIIQDPPGKSLKTGIVYGALYANSIFA